MIEEFQLKKDSFDEILQLKHKFQIRKDSFKEVHELKHKQQIEILRFIHQFRALKLKETFQKHHRVYDQKYKKYRLNENCMYDLLL